MKRTMLLLSWVAFSLIFAQAQELDFAFNIGNSGSEEGRAIASNEYRYFTTGGYYATGTLSGTVDFDPSPGVSTRSSAGMQDIYLASYDSAGNLNWVTDFGGSLNDVPNSISVYYNSIFITGLFRGTVDFDPGVGSTIRTASGDADIFLVKFDWGGNFQWVVTMGGSSSVNTEAGIGVYASPTGPYVTGVFEGSFVDFNPNGSTSYLQATGDQNIFIAKYNTNGLLSWAQSVGSGILDDGGGTCITYDGNNIYVGGSFAGSCDFNPGTPGGVLTSAGGQDGFIASYTAGGTYRWAHRIGGPLHDEVNDIDIDKNGLIGITGSVFGNVSYTGGSFTTNGGSQDALIAQLSDNGTFQWAYPLGGVGPNDVGYTIEMTDCGRIYVGGNFCGTADFDPGAGVANLTGPACGFPTPAYSYFLACYDEAGNYRWASGGTSSGGNSSVRGLCLGLCNNLVATGGFNRAQDFDISASTYTLAPAGNTDAFISKHFLPQITISTDDLRDFETAITCANIHKGRDSVIFCIPGSGPHIFDRASINSTPLPYITDDYTIIDATTQPGWTIGNIVIDGNGLLGTTYGLRFDGGDHGEALGLSVRRFSAHGIYAFNADHVAVRDCQVGGNGQDGIRFFNSAYGTVEGCIIGLSPTPNATDPNGRDGIATNGTADHTQIGGTTTATRNYIGGNARYGIYLQSNENQVEGNYIGYNLFFALGNGSDGIRISGDLNRIGGNSPNAANVIAFNTGQGIELTSASAYQQNHFWRNEYFCNGQEAIEINIANQAIAPPTITLADASAIYGTGVAGGSVEIYAPDSSGCSPNTCQGRFFLGSASIDGAGNWSLPGSFNGGQRVLALQTDGNLNTSEFSNCVVVQTLLAVGNIQLKGTPSSNSTHLSWEYPILNQPAIFRIERSPDTIHWKNINSITAETGAKWSELTDNAPAPGFMYYRVGMWLEDGNVVYSNVVGVQCIEKDNILIFPNPAQDYICLQTYMQVAHLRVIDIGGRLVLEKKHLISEKRIEISHLPKGIYQVKIGLDENGRVTDFNIPLLITN